LNKIITDQNNIDKASWDKFMTDHPNGNFFQSPAYYYFYRTLPQYEPIVIAYIDNTNDIIGILVAVIQKEKGYIKSKLSSRCIIFGGPVVKDDNKEITDLLLKELIKKVESRSIYIEFRNFFDLSKSKKQFETNRFKFKEHLNFIIEIGPAEENFKKLNENRRRQIKKGIKSGAEIVEANDIDEVREFYYLLQKLYREKVKKPLPDFNFFEIFYSTPNLGKYFLVKYDCKIIGGIMCPVYKDIVYEWYICGLDIDYRDQSPSVLATWAAIEYAVNKELKYFDFMGAGGPDDDYGVREFKSKFGGKELRFGRYTKINQPKMYWIGKIGLKILQKLK
jgi:lipid II:glycine glycyltransferase (peptidoglycan interpeptide bridge formation enzyme)